MRTLVHQLWRLGERLSPYLAVLVAIVIAALSLVPAEEVPGPSLNDKIGHVLAYGVLTALAAIGFQTARWSSLAAGVLIYGLAMEALQGLMPLGREASGLDVLANLVGVGLGLGLALLSKRLFSAI